MTRYNVQAGLYSAVLTALLAVSYQNLLPNPSDTIIALLRQIMLQTHTFTISTSFMNSTAPPSTITPTQPFQPSLATKRVNGLWFASLTLSLISASFSILAKQWLSEYLFTKYSSPLSQLRIRHYRATHWRVFTIAATLPHILQLALALFFVGLCLFTFDVHQSIVYTTLPLVTAWALLMVSALCSPLLSPRRSYKLSLLTNEMQLSSLRNALPRVFNSDRGAPVSTDKAERLNKRGRTWSLGYNEHDTAKDPSADVDIFAAADANQGDDQLLVTLCAALLEMHTKPDNVLKFVLKSVDSRLQTDFANHPLPLISDLSQLSPQTCTILMDTVADVLGRELKKIPTNEPIEWTKPMRGCLSLLVGDLPCLLSDKAAAVVALFFADAQSSRSQDTFEWMFQTVPPQERHILCHHLLQRLRVAFLHLNAWQLCSTVSILMKSGCCTCGRCSTIDSVMTRHADADTLPPTLTQSVCDVVTRYLLNQVKIGAIWSECHREILLLLLGQWWSEVHTPWHSLLHELVRCLLTMPQSAPNFFPHLFHNRDYLPAAESIFGDTFPSLAGEPC